MRILSEILPQRCAIDFELRPGDLSATVIVSALVRKAAVESALQLFPDFVGEGCHGQVHEVEYDEVERSAGRALAIQRGTRASRTEIWPQLPKKEG